MKNECTLRYRIKLLTWLFIVGLVASGATAIPIRWEVDTFVEWLNPHGMGVQPLDPLEPVTRWLLQVQGELPAADAKNGVLFSAPTGWPSATSSSPSLLSAPCATRCEIAGCLSSG